MTEIQRAAVKMPPHIIIGDHTAYYREKEHVHVFPFVAIDPTPGGSNLGRIQWMVEPLRAKQKRGGRYWIEWLLVWAMQTRDPQYAQYVFQIPVWIDCLMTTRRGGGALDSFYAGVWRAFPCETHGGLVFDAYPENHHSELVIDTYVSSGYIHFR